MTTQQRRSALRRAALFALGLSAVLGAGRVRFSRPEVPSGPALDDGYVRATGVVHVHTTFSDGGGTPRDVARAASAAGLAFVFVNDHNTVEAKAAEGYQDGVLLGAGIEISTTGGHLLALGLEDPAFRMSGTPREALDDVRLLGAKAFAAHPLSQRADFRWTGWDLPGGWGLEILNGDSQWREAGWARLAWGSALYGLNARRALLAAASRPSRVLERWDALLARRDVAGLAGADAHARLTLGRSIHLALPSYDATFGLMRNHVLLRAPPTGEAAADLSSVVEALRLGRSYMAFDALCPADEFAFFAELDGRRFTMGETIPYAPGVRLRAGGPGPKRAEYVLFRDGREIARAPRLDVVADQPGVYRVEGQVAGSDLAWIISNPIYVFDARAARLRAANAAWPEPGQVPGARRPLDLGGFALEFDPGSALERAVLPRGGQDGGPALGLRFRLGQRQRESHGWCALVSREPRDLAAYAGVTMRLKADGVYRLWLQVRDRNPQGSDEGSETWLASLRTSSAWQRLAIPFADLRSLDPHSDGQLDLGQVTTLGLVIDELTVKPGTAGALVLDDLGLY